MTASAVIAPTTRLGLQVAVPNCLQRPLCPRPDLELLAPARDADIGIEAINHGADAVYIGGPAFGARDKAGNSMADLARLAAHAHRYGARIFLTLNTILRVTSSTARGASPGTPGTPALTR